MHFILIVSPFKICSLSCHVLQTIFHDCTVNIFTCILCICACPNIVCFPVRILLLNIQYNFSLFLYNCCFCFHSLASRISKVRVLNPSWVQRVHNTSSGVPALDIIWVPIYISLSGGFAGAYCACSSRCGWRLFGHFFSRPSFLSSISRALGDGPI